MLPFKKKKRNIKTIIIELFFIVLLPITIVTLAGNYYTKYILQKQAADYNRGTLVVHMETVDTRLENLSRSMYMLLYQSIDVSKLQQYNDMIIRTDEQLNIKRSLSTYYNAYSDADGLFFYSPSTKDYAQSSQGNETTKERSIIKDYIINAIHEKDDLDFLEGVWQPVKINNKYLLIKVIQKDYAFLGSWIWIDSLNKPLRSLGTVENSMVFITNKNNIPLNKLDFIKTEGIHVDNSVLDTFQLSNKHTYLIIGVPSSKGNFHLYMCIPYRIVMQKIYHIEMLIMLVYLFTIILLVVIFFQIKRLIIQPMDALKNGMIEIQSGNLDVILTLPEEPVELSVVTHAFNDMAKDIKNLKIQVYEEQLEKSRTLLHYLNLQIKPHFFLNSLNIIYSLALTKDYKLIMDMSKCLTNYLRYIFKSSDSMVLIKEELMHIENYMHIQELRFTTQFRIIEDIEPGLDNIRIPILSIHTFVENAIKHAYTNKSTLEVEIHVKTFTDAIDTFLNITVSNNGKEFSPQQLEELNSPVNMQETRDEHLGILNIKQRLYLIYQDKASLSFSNDPSGITLVTVTIPLNRKEFSYEHSTR